MKIVTKIGKKYKDTTLFMRVTTSIAGHQVGFVETGKAYLYRDGSRLFLSRDSKEINGFKLVKQTSVYNASKPGVNFITLPKEYTADHPAEYMVTEYTAEGLFAYPFTEKELYFY